MDFGWVFLGFIGFIVVVALVHVVSRMASERDTLARRKRSRMLPMSGDTNTYAGRS